MISAITSSVFERNRLVEPINAYSNVNQLFRTVTANKSHYNKYITKPLPVAKITQLHSTRVESSG